MVESESEGPIFEDAGLWLYNQSFDREGLQMNKAYFNWKAVLSQSFPVIKT